MATAAGGGVGAGGGGAMGSGAVGGKGCLALWWLRDIGEYSLGVVTVLDHVYGLNGAAVDAAVGANDLFALDGADLGEVAGEDEGLGGKVAEGMRGSHANAARLRVVLSKLDIHGHFIGDRPAEGVEDAAYVLRVYVRGQSRGVQGGKLFGLAGQGASLGGGGLWDKTSGEDGAVRIRRLQRRQYPRNSRRLWQFGVGGLLCVVATHQGDLRWCSEWGVGRGGGGGGRGRGGAGGGGRLRSPGRHGCG